jgi:hypothetical protein
MALLFTGQGDAAGLVKMALSSFSEAVPKTCQQQQPSIASENFSAPLAEKVATAGTDGS